MDSSNEYCHRHTFKPLPCNNFTCLTNIIPYCQTFKARRLKHERQLKEQAELIAAADRLLPLPPNPKP